MNLLLWLDYRFFEVRRSIFLHSAYPPGPSLESIFQHGVSHRVVHVISNTAVNSSEIVIIFAIWTHIWKWRQRGLQRSSNLLLMTQKVNGSGRIRRKNGKLSEKPLCAGHQLREVDAEKPSQPLTQSPLGRGTWEVVRRAMKDALKDWKKCLGSNQQIPCLSEGCIRLGHAFWQFHSILSNFLLKFECTRLHRGCYEKCLFLHLICTYQAENF